MIGDEDQGPNDLLLVIRAGMKTEKGVKWVGADKAHDAVLCLLDRRLAGRVNGSDIDDLSDEIMDLLFGLPTEIAKEDEL